MKTTETNKETLNRWRSNHHAALETLRGSCCKKTGLQLWRSLCRIERRIHADVTAYCNGEIDSDAFEAAKEKAENDVEKLFCAKPKGFFINSDPRGYSLKLECDSVPSGMHTDWGRYGIMAAVIDI